jgi:hypothetical protein
MGSGPRSRGVSGRSPDCEKPARPAPAAFRERGSRGGSGRSEASSKSERAGKAVTHWVAGEARVKGLPHTRPRGAGSLWTDRWLLGRPSFGSWTAACWSSPAARASPSSMFLMRRLNSTSTATDTRELRSPPRLANANCRRLAGLDQWRTAHTCNHAAGVKRAAPCVGDIALLNRAIPTGLTAPLIAQQMVGAGGFEPPTPRPPV